MATRPNLIVIMTDQQNFRMLSCAGNPHLKTPNLDRLAARGVRLENTYCTHPLCVPSRFSLFTGRMPSEINQFDNDQTEGKTPEAIVKQGLGHLVKQAGYRAFYGGKMHFPGYWSPNLGFEHYCNDDRDGLAAAAADKLRELKAGSDPFLLVASFINPHDVCYMAVNDFMEDTPQSRRMKENIAYASAQEPLREAMRLPDGMDEDAFYATVCPPLPDNHEVQPDGPEAKRPTGHRAKVARTWDERRWRLHRWAYCRLAERVDRQIGRVLDAVDQTGLADDTVIIFTSDHGENDASHKLEQKTEFYDESARVPLILSDPRSTAKGTVSAAMVSNGLDLVPTVCDYAGVSAPDDLRGLSLKPLVRGKAATLPRSFVPVENAAGRMIVSARYKYAEYDFGANAVQLNDRADDPGEMRNAAGDPDKRAVVDDHRRMLTAWFGAADHWPGEAGFGRTERSVAH